ncbi:hypothetical protein VKT23_016202 [Stygiomarasmius scandens]|uniref:Ubiquitin-like protease family profile domain-containing protein n=1 Tax=Marasmiellus scandens TaxID=2682957 RepID=A0ABR1IX20_9AGAR
MISFTVKGDITQSSNYVISHTDVTTKLLDVFPEHDTTTANSYGACEWLKHLGKEVFVNGKTFVTIVHLGKLPAKKHEKDGADHWVPLVLDGKTTTLHYGNSLCGKKSPVPPLRLVTAYTKWKAVHTSSELKIDELPVSCQHDGFSCGAFAFNAVDAYVHPLDVELLKLSQAAYLQLQMMAKIIRWCKHMGADEPESSNNAISDCEEPVLVENISDFTTIAKGTRFTFTFEPSMSLPSITNVSHTVTPPPKQPISHSAALTPNLSPSKHKQHWEANIDSLPPWSLEPATSLPSRCLIDDGDVFGYDDSSKEPQPSSNQHVTSPAQPQLKTDPVANLDDGLQPSTPKQTTLTGFFKKVTAAEAEVQCEREFEKLHNVASGKQSTNSDPNITKIY